MNLSRVIRVRQVEDGNLRKSEVTLFEEFRRKNKELVEDMRPNDVIAFVGLSKKSVLFVFANKEFQASNDSPANHAVTSVKHRITDGDWNPLKLRQYINKAGFETAGLQKYEEHLARQMKEGK